MEIFRNYRNEVMVTKRLLLLFKTHLDSTVGQLSPMHKPLQRIRLMPVFAHPGGDARSFLLIFRVASFLGQAGSSLNILKQN